MATRTPDKATENRQETQKSGLLQAVSKDVQGVEQKAQPVIGFWTKFNNDWAMTFASALAYNLLMAIFPIAIALLAILGLVVGLLNHQAYVQLATTITNSLPSSVSGPLHDTLLKQEHQLAAESIILAVIGVVLAIFNGSRLFVLIEGCFGIIYHIRQRAAIKQNLMALGMLLLFVILIPIMVVASSLPTFAVTILQRTPLGHLPGSGVVLTLGGIIGSLIASFLLFEAIYIIVPNQHISIRNSWLGALVAAVLLQVYLTLYPLYAAHFITGYAGSISSFIILLIFFYYFAVILFLGAEVNAYFAEGVKTTPTDLVSLVHISTSHLPKSQQDQEQQAAASHKQQAPGDVAAKTHVDDTVKSSGRGASTPGSTNSSQQPQQMTAANSTKAMPQDRQELERERHELAKERQKARKAQQAATPSKIGTAMAAVAGTALAFVIEWIQLRRRTPQRK